MVQTIELGRREEINGHKKTLLNQEGFCGAEWIRTTDSRIFSPMLYQLSYSTALRGHKSSQKTLSSKNYFNKIKKNQPNP